jgi:hypothetical protein
MIELFRKCFYWLTFLVTSSAHAQKHHPVRWNFSAIPGANNDCTIYYVATIDKGWHLCSQFTTKGGPMPTSFHLVPNRAYSIAGAVNELGTPHKTYEQAFKMEVTWFSDIVIFSQRIKLNVAETTIKGKVVFAAYASDMCLTPEEVKFELIVR